MSLFAVGNKTFEISVLDYIKSVTSGPYEIPTFQRDYVWAGKKKKITDLLDSINRGFNIGTVVFWKSKINLARKEDNLGNSKDDKGYFNYIIDGQQRTLTMVSIFSLRNNHLVNKEEFYMELLDGELSFTHKKPKHTIYISLEKFVTQSLHSINDEINYEEDFPEFDDETISKFRTKVKIFKDKLTTRKIIIGYKISIKEGDLSIAINQFERINAAGIKLSEFEILNAMAYTDKKYKLSEQSKDKDFKKIADVINGGGKFSPESIKIILNSYKLVKNYITNLSTEEDHFALSADAISNFVEGDADIIRDVIALYKELLSELHSLGIKSIKDVPYTHNSTLFIFIKYIINTSKGRILDIDNKDFLFRIMMMTGLQKSYDKSASQQLIKHIKTVIDQIRASQSIVIKENLDFDVSTQEILNTKYSSIKAYEKAILMYWGSSSSLSKNNIDYKDQTQIVKLDGIFKKSKNLDHIFPQVIYKGDKYFDSLANIAIVTEKTNKSKGSEKPSSYFGKIPFEDNYDMYESHSIGEDAYRSIEEDSLPQFVTERSNSIAVELTNLLKSFE